MPAGDLEHLLSKSLGIAEKIAGEGIVLLKNHNNILPLSSEVPLAVFGRGHVKTCKGEGIDG